MAETKIEWTQQTWNPIVGCSILSAGCANCYAMSAAYRLMHNPNSKIEAKFEGTARLSGGRAVWTGRVNLDEGALLAPLKRKAPTTWFVNSLSDLFHEDVSDATIDRVFAVMALCPQHKFQVLTKRSARMRAYLGELAEGEEGSVVERWQLIVSSIEGLSDLGVKGPDDPRFEWPLPNVWLGVSVEDQAAADARIPDLLATPVAVRFLSCEPLLGAVDLTFLRDGYVDALAGIEGEGTACLRSIEAIDWVICGGESGPRARPMHPDWARGVRDQCAAAGVPFFFKQWGEWGPDTGPCGDGADPIMEGKGPCAALIDGEWHISRNGYLISLENAERSQGEWIYRLGKKANGRHLDGVEHNEIPA